MLSLNIFKRVFFAGKKIVVLVNMLNQKKKKNDVSRKNFFRRTIPLRSISKFNSQFQIFNFDKDFLNMMTPSGHHKK